MDRAVWCQVRHNPLPERVDPHTSVDSMGRVRAGLRPRPGPLLGAAARFGTMLLAAFIFPLFPGAFLVDTGPVGISLVLLAAVLLLVGAAARAETTRRAWLPAAAAGAIAFLGVWVKLNFAWLLPA